MTCYPYTETITCTLCQSELLCYGCKKANAMVGLVVDTVEEYEHAREDLEPWQERLIKRYRPI